jgi:hypothetical protein
MTSGNGQGQASGKEPVERILDLFVHMPIGLAVLAWKRMPEIMTAMPEFVGQAMARGCSTLADAEDRISDEMRKARMIGQVAVTFGGRQLRKEVDARLRDARQAAGGVVGFIPGVAPGGTNGAGERGAPAVSATATRKPTKAPSTKPRTTPTKAAKAPAPPPSESAADLPIREYDGLSASQVVSRLTGLSPDELRAVRSYEESSRGRRTVILAIDRLLD